jgi:hypothetical protein
MAALVRREECASASAVSSEVKLKLGGLATLAISKRGDSHFRAS